MYSEKILTCVGRLHICSQQNQYDPYWNFCWFQIRQLWKFLQVLIALIYENVILWPWQVTVHFFFNEYLVLRTSNSMLSLEAHQLAFFVLCFGSDIWLHVSGSGKRRGKEAIFFHLNLFHGFINICRCQIQGVSQFFLFKKSLLIERKLVSPVEILRFSQYQLK